MRRLFALLSIALMLLAVSCTAYSEERHAFIMDTWCSITVYEREDAALLEEAFALLEQLDARLDRHDEASEVARINEAAGREAVAVSEDTFALIARAKELSLVTDGAFNPLLGAISDLWGFGTEQAHVPDSERIASLLDSVDISALVLDDAEGTVYLASPSIELDLGGIAKGYAADILASFLRENGVGRAIINLGGNVWCLGCRSDGSAWVVALQDPEAADGSWFTTVSVCDSSVVTSGSYQRFFVEDGVTYHHILDPATGWPAESDIASVTVVDSDSTKADALSTALFVMGREAAEAWCLEHGIKAVILSTDGEMLRIGL